MQLTNPSTKLGKNVLQTALTTAGGCRPCQMSCVRALLEAQVPATVQQLSRKYFAGLPQQGYALQLCSHEAV